MADQVTNAMGNLNMNNGPQGNSYIPPHMRGKMNPGGPGPAGPMPGPGPMAANNGAWAGNGT